VGVDINHAHSFMLGYLRVTAVWGSRSAASLPLHMAVKVDAHRQPEFWLEVPSCA
jgi:hypothetical protein